MAGASSASRTWARRNGASAHLIRSPRKLLRAVVAWGRFEQRMLTLRSQRSPAAYFEVTASKARDGYAGAMVGASG
jgi:hypothetical protein